MEVANKQLQPPPPAWATTHPCKMHPPTTTPPALPPPRPPTAPPSLLVRSESAPTNIQKPPHHTRHSSTAQLPDLSLSDDDRIPTVTFAPAPPRPSPSAKPPPARSHSSVELANIVNARPFPESSKKRTTPAWHKSVFDMIQDDFPKTPSPMFSTLLSRPDPTPETRRSRLASTSSLDLDLAQLSIPPDQPSDLPNPKPPPRPIHRRSVSINWTGDLPTSPTHTASPPTFFPDPPVASPATSISAAPPPVSAQLPPTLARSRPASPAQSLSPTSSNSAPRLAPSPPPPPLAQPSPPHSNPPSLPFSHQSLPQHQHQHQPVQQHHHQPLNPYPVPVQSLLAQSPVEDVSVPRFPDYDYLYDQSDTLPSTTPNSLASVYPAQTAPFSAQSQPTLAMPPVPSPSQYTNVFPGMGLFPSPFSTNPSGIANGPVYTDSFRDGLAAADNLKNMSMQMAAFLSAQQQLYAAQMAQMAAITANSPFTSTPPTFPSPAVPRSSHVAHPGRAAHLRSKWDSREHSPPAHRPYPRAKHHYDTYRPASAHVGPQKKGPALELGHKGRPGRGRRAHRGHDDVAMLPSHKGGDRVGLGGSAMPGALQDSGHSRSPLLEEFRATSLSIGRSIGSVGDVGFGGAFAPGTVGQALHNGREWQLSEIKDNVVEFATDQHGSRFIQQKLESASAQDKDSVLKHALTDAHRLMTDVFGNYVVQKLLDHGGENAVKLIAAELEGRMLVLSLHMYGCRVVQKALEVLESRARAALVRELDGHVLKCIRDQNGNHVIQKCVELVESDAVQFIVDSVQGQAVGLAGHSYGCRVVQRILEHGASHQKAPIMLEIMSSIADLIKDQYGNYVIQHVVEHGTVEERSVIMNLVREEVCQLSQHKFASNVVERCLQHGSMEERQILIEILIVGEGPPNASPLNHLVRDQFGNYVVQRVLDVARPPQRERVVTILRAQVPAIKKYSYGKHIIARLEEHQASAGTSGYHHSQGAHVHPSGHSVHRSDRHVSPTMMPVSVSHNIPRGPHDFMYYE